ncbi:MAG: Fic family protein [Eggerthellaceae bacterium]|nr:Fic family protein [Eggerthellaceae bacterium]
MYDEERPYDVVDESDPQRRIALWGAASGLQAVDGLVVSSFAESVGDAYKRGEYSAYDARDVIEAHYVNETGRQAEADVVTGRILTMLNEAGCASFTLAPRTLLRIHKTLFDGELPDASWVGAFRREMISKSEPILGGRSVRYERPDVILDALEYDFTTERAKPYPRDLGSADILRFAKFIASVWQIHPFREGNTRTIAVFSQLYLAELGFEPDNSVYADNSRWFRDALVRASYSSIRDGIDEDSSFIAMFFENIALGAKHDLASFDLNVHGIRIDQEIPYRELGDMSDRA